MPQATAATRILRHEALSLLSRLERIKPFSLTETMVPAAAVSPSALDAIERHLSKGRITMRGLIRAYIEWLRSPEGLKASPSDAHRRLAFLRMKFNALLSQFDIFADVLSQRSEHVNGVWIAGLDAVAADALSLPGGYYKPIPVICYTDRGIGAAIRRARARLPGGAGNPVAVIRVPRERMVGSGIASSLVHEVGHQGSDLLGLVPSLRPVLEAHRKTNGANASAWTLWSQWISEVLADFWSVAKVGVASTLGLMGVVGLPRTFMFRYTVTDPHPAPYSRVRLSCAMGNALYPHPQWRTLSQLWESFYPLEGLDERRKKIIGGLEASMPEFVNLLVNHRPKSLDGKSLAEAMAIEERQPSRLAVFFRSVRENHSVALRRSPPCFAFAAIGQARMDGAIDPWEECALIAKLLEFWALQRRTNNKGDFGLLPAISNRH